jgi:hypothetical protein
LILDDCELKRIKPGEAVTQTVLQEVAQTLWSADILNSLNDGAAQTVQFALHCRILCTNGKPLSEFKKIVNPRRCYIAMALMRKENGRM